MRDNLLYAYKPGTRHAITVLDKKTHRCPWTGKTKEDITNEHPDIEFLEWFEFRDRIKNSCVTPPKEITWDRYYSALECLPPLNWHISPNFECFHMSEFLVENYTATYAKVGDRFFTWTDTVNATPEKIKNKLMKAFPSLMR